MSSDVQIGKVLDNYRIVEILGEGGMGIVLKAVHTKLDKVVALKMIVSGLSMNTKFIRRFQTEAQALAKLQNPNIVAVHDLRSYENQWFIVMEYVDGIDLFDIINRDGAFSWQESIKIVKQILSAIGHAHNAGIIHRDLKPHNIMLTKDMTVKITDFGLAKDEADKRQTQTVASGGSLNYMSPEHVRGFSFIEKRSDLYCIGIILYEMVTGGVPFKNLDSDFDIRESILRKDFDTPTKINRKIPAELDGIIMKSINKSAKDRFQSAGEMLQAIVDFENGNKFTYLNESLTDTLSKTAVKIVIPILLLMIFGFVGYYFNYFDFFSPKATNSEIIEYPASNLSLSTIPEKATIYINGDSVALSPLDDYVLEAGSYALKLSKNNYESIDTTIAIEKDKSRSFAFTLKSAFKEKKELLSETRSMTNVKQIPKAIFASMYITSNPTAAKVLLDGKNAGQTPVRLSKLESGNYSIKIIKDGFEDYSDNIRIKPQDSKNINAILKKYSGNLTINTVPGNVTLTLDGKKYQVNGGSFQLSDVPIGMKKVKVSKNGFAEFSKEVEIRRNVTNTIDATLDQLMGTLRVKIRPWGTIAINNEVHKSSADTKYETELPVDKHLLRVEHPTLGYWQKEIEINNNNLTEVLVNFNKKIPITISAFGENGEPFAGKIYIDNKFTGTTTPQELKIPVGVHKIYVEKEGYTLVNGRREVLIDSDNKEPISFVLRQNE